MTTGAVPAWIETVARWRVSLGFVSGIAALLLARPTATSVVAGSLVAAAGEAVRLWAAGHLEKSREVTTSGPYRFVGHPLYLGTTIMGIGLAIASRRVAVALLVIAYLAVTLTVAMRREEAFLRERFADDYETYRHGEASSSRRFSLERVVRNREYRAVIGLAAVMGLLWVKSLWPRY